MITSRKIIIASIVIAIVSGIAYKLADVKQNQRNDIILVNKSKSAVPVTVVLAKLGNITYDILYHGTFEPNYEVTVVSEAQGKIKSYTIEEGVFITEGNVMASLENDILSYQLENAEATYAKANSDLNRFEKLTPGEAVSTQQLEDTRLALSNAKSNYLTLKKQYNNSFIKAPVSGIVARRYIEKGTFIAPGSPVADIVDTRIMKFIAFFSAADLVQVKNGQTVKISTELYPNTSYQGIIKVVGIKADESKRYRIQAEVQNSSTQPLIPGTDGILTINLKQGRKNIMVPRNCIVGSVIEPTVYVVENGVAKERKIVIDKIKDGQAFVSDGLSEGEQVVLSGQINLEDDTKVSISDSINL